MAGDRVRDAAPRVLGIVDAPYRGSVERGYADCFYLALVLGAQLDGLTLLLRGEAVPLGHVPPDGASGSPRLDVDTLATAGVRILVSRADRYALGLADVPLRGGVTAVDDAPALWAHHDAVWFL